MEEFCNGGSERCPVSMRLSSRYSSDREAKKAKIRAELLARRERQILEEEVRRELGWESGIRFGCCHGEREEAPPVASSWDKFYDYEPEVEGLRRHRMGSWDLRIVDAACGDVGCENRSGLREAKKMKIRAELLARRERQVLEEEVRRELGLEMDIMSRCCDGERDDGCLLPRLEFEGRHLPELMLRRAVERSASPPEEDLRGFINDTLRRSPAYLPDLMLRPTVKRSASLPKEDLPSFINDMLRRSPAGLPDLMLTPAVERSASPAEENIQPFSLFPDFLPLDGVEPEPSSRPSLVAIDSVSKPCVKPVSSPKPLPTVVSAVHEPEPRLSGSSPIPEYKPLSNNYSGNKRKFTCELCQITATSKESLDDHFNGKRHKASTASNKSNNVSASKPLDSCSSAEAENLNKPKKNRPGELSCKACGLKCDSKSILHAHLIEKKHWIRSTGN